MTGSVESVISRAEAVAKVFGRSHIQRALDMSLNGKTDFAVSVAFREMVPVLADLPRRMGWPKRVIGDGAAEVVERAWVGYPYGRVLLDSADTDPLYSAGGVRGKVATGQGSPEAEANGRRILDLMPEFGDPAQLLYRLGGPFKTGLVQWAEQCSASRKSAYRKNPLDRVVPFFLTCAMTGSLIAFAEDLLFAP